MPLSPKDAFADALRSSTRNIPVTELAARTGLSRQQIHRYLSGDAIPRADAFVQLCRVLGLDPFDFFAPTDAEDTLKNTHMLPEIDEPDQDKLSDGGYILYSPSLQRPNMFDAKACFVTTIGEKRAFYIRYKRTSFHFDTPKHVREIKGWVYTTEIDNCQFVGVWHNKKGKVAAIHTFLGGPHHPMTGCRLGIFSGPDNYPSNCHPYAVKAVLTAYPDLSFGQVYRRSGLVPKDQVPPGVLAYFTEPIPTTHTLWGTAPEV